MNYTDLLDESIKLITNDNNFTLFDAIIFLSENDELFNYEDFSKWLKANHSDIINSLKQECLKNKSHKDFKKNINCDNININELF